MSGQARPILQLHNLPMGAFPDIKPFNVFYEVTEGTDIDDVRVEFFEATEAVEESLSEEAEARLVPALVEWGEFLPSVPFDVEGFYLGKGEVGLVLASCDVDLPFRAVVPEASFLLLHVPPADDVVEPDLLVVRVGDRLLLLRHLLVPQPPHHLINHDLRRALQIVQLLFPSQSEDLPVAGDRSCAHAGEDVGARFQMRVDVHLDGLVEFDHVGCFGLLVGPRVEFYQEEVAAGVNCLRQVEHVVDLELGVPTDLLCDDVLVLLDLHRRPEIRLCHRQVVQVLSHAPRADLVVVEVLALLAELELVLQPRKGNAHVPLVHPSEPQQRIYEVLVVEIEVELRLLEDCLQFQETWPLTSFVS
mmetsp:Transcript_33219/g.32318  ORF Transcript_33219/g.32318 Transcript_33219/m.32318 type:complete len:360 (-) Transcript_33219:661-1740(-)